ncbi:MAG TPA: TonB-dependent receptor [Dongiaceae bacterium]|nr:TonB-dependent receptor [Dongiaceae bacterium]
MKRFKFAILAFASLALLSSLSFGQAVYGNIIGTVSDASGAAVANAPVTVTDIDRGTTYQTTTNASGNYEQTHLIAGRYKVVVSAPGFAKFEVTADVQIDASTRVDATLSIKGETSQIEVTAETPLLKTDRADVSTTLTTKELGDLPIINRNLTFMMLVTPGTQINDWQHASSENPQGGYQIDANGQQFTSNGFLLDGTENNSSILGIAVINPNIDSLQEFKITTSNYDAQFGSVAGALMQATTKSGTNSLHGSAFEYLRNDYFNAKDWTSGQLLPLRWNQFGGSIGGPIIKNKVFFFADYEGTRRRRAASVQTTVPNSAERSGDFSALLGDYICSDKSSQPTPCTSPFLVGTTEGGSVPAQVGMVFDPTTGNPDGTGRLAVSTGGRVNVLPSVPAPISNLLANLPMPQDDTSISGNYIATGSEKFDSNQFDTRVDYTFSDQLHFFGRYTLADFSHSAPGAYGAEAGGPGLNGIFFAGNAPARNQSIALGATYTLSPRLITDFRFGFYRYRIRVYPNGVGTTPASDAGIPGLNLGTTETSGMPAFYVNGNGGFSFGYALGVNQCNCPLKETENHFQWVNNWTMTHGNHTFAWGVDIRRAQQQRIPSDSHRSGEISFSEGTTGSADVDAQDPITGNVPDGPTGSGIASLFFGVPGSFSRYFTGLNYQPGLRQTRLFFYGQDSWRITRKLTLNYGLRYENYLPQTAAHPGGAGSFDPNTGEVLVAGVGSVPANMGVQAYNLGFAPRLGLAYQLMEHTVIRAGYGRSFTPSGLGAVFGQAPDYDPPVTIPQQLNQNNNYEPVYNLFSGPPLPPNPTVGTNGRFPLPGTLNVFYFFNPPSAYRIPLADSWNLAVQHQFTPTLTAEVAYIGNVGRHLFINPNVNQAAPPDPNSDPATWNDYDSRRLFFQRFGLSQGIYETCNCDNSSYHALQAKVQKRAAQGLDFLVTYTYSKAMANSETGGAFSNNLNWWQDHGPANYDRTHTVTISHTYQLPFGRGRRWGSNMGRAMDMILGGWDFSGISRFESGLPFTVFSDGPNLYADFNSVRPDQVGDPHVPHPSANMWFNADAFAVPQEVGRNGDVRHNSLRGPRFNQLDLSLGKVFRVTESKTIEFKWENYNAFNHVNLANPNSYIGDPQNVGKIYAAADMRQMQFGLHFRF